MNNNRNISTFSPFITFCQHVIPLAYDESMSYYETLCALRDYLLNKVIPAVNNNADAVTELQNAFNTLQNYIDNYFKNLDVQEEINNKLDEMVKDGTFRELIENYLDMRPSIISIDNIETLKNYNGLTNGTIVETLGYYNINDGGNGKYLIRDKQINDIDDNGSIIFIKNNKVAELIVTDEIKTKQFGAKGDGINNDTLYIQNLLNYVKNNKYNGITIYVNGLHLVNYGLELKGTSENTLENITFKGLNGTKNYLDFNSLVNGFKFISTIDNTLHYGLNFDYITGLKIEYLKITSDEIVDNGEIPLNLIIGIYYNHSNGINIKKCNITKLGFGIRTYGNGLSYIESNNISLCNCGIWLQESGDNILRDNYINTCGWNIYGNNGTLKSKYNVLGTNLFACAMRLGSCGTSSIYGGKIEWNANGIIQDYGGYLNYSNIQFDMNVVAALIIDDHFRTGGQNITNCVFNSNGAFAKNGYLGGADIVLWRTNTTNISNCSFNDGGNSYKNAFKDSINKYYGPNIASIYIISSRLINITNNNFNSEQPPIKLNSSSVNFSNNNYITPYRIDYTSQIYTSNSTNKLINGQTTGTSNVIKSGDYNIGDIIYKNNNINTGWICTEAGTLNSINNTCTVLIENDYGPDDGSVISLNNLPDTYGIGSYIDIEGVTGTKKIIGLIFKENNYYAKLNSPCDVAVINAQVTNHQPIFNIL